MPAYAAKIPMEKVDWGKDFLRTCGWNMAEVEVPEPKKKSDIQVINPPYMILVMRFLIQISKKRRNVSRCRKHPSASVFI
jgi:hypothetical protein